jgi:hypothetical protein
MKMTFPVTYTDAFGKYETYISTEGDSLEMTIRDIRFTGSNYWSFELLEPSDRGKVSFELDEYNYLIGYYLKAVIPLTAVMRDGSEQPVDLLIDTTPGLQSIMLLVNCEKFVLGSPSLEFALLPAYIKHPDIQYLQTCGNCWFSEYNPFGEGFFCFKKNKQECDSGLYHRMKTEQIPCEVTQEFYSCAEFELK